MSKIRTVNRFVVTAATCACLGLGAFAHADDAATATKKSTPMISMGGMQPAGGVEHAAVQGEGSADADLKLDLRKFDFEGTKAQNHMYMPEGVPLVAKKPDLITKEPQYAGTPKYAVIKLGTAAPNQFAIAVDEVEGKEPKIYLDLNGDGDLTNDQTGEWEKKTEGKEGGQASYFGTYTFTPGYKTPEGATTPGQYAVNFYWQPGRGSLNYYGASARVGKITIDSKEYDVTVIENDADGNFNKLYDHTKPIIVGEKMTKPVWLLLDGDQFDIRGTFPFGGMNYLATVSDDASKIHLAPTMKVVRPPRPEADRPTMLAAGVMAPDFEALGWSADQTQLQADNRFKLSDYRGKKIVVVDMWATWCGPCMKGIPHLSKVAESVAGQDVEVIALNTSDDQIPFERFATGKGKEYKFKLARDPAGRDPNGNTIAKKLYGVTGIPATFVIDKSGKIVGTVSGYTEGDTNLEQILSGLGVKMK